MASQDVYMKRPRTPNDQYTVMTEEQIRNVRKKPETFFAAEVHRSHVPSQGPPREGGRYYMDRYCHVINGGNARNEERTANILHIDSQIRPHDVPIAHDCSIHRASAKWGPQKTGQRTRGHFFGEEIDQFTTIDMFRRPATMYTGRVVMDCGRPGDGYYTQRFPDRASWNRSTAKLNCTNVLDSVQRKTYDDYDRVLEAEQTARRYRDNQWPEYSEYTAGFLLRTKLPRKLTQLEQNQKHAAYGQQLQAAENALAAAQRHEMLRQCMPPRGLTRDVTVLAT